MNYRLVQFFLYDCVDKGHTSNRLQEYSRWYGDGLEVGRGRVVARDQLGVDVAVQLAVQVVVALVLEGRAASGALETLHVQVLVLDADEHAAASTNNGSKPTTMLRDFIELTKTGCNVNISTRYMLTGFRRRLLCDLSSNYRAGMCITYSDEVRRNENMLKYSRHHMYI